MWIPRSSRRRARAASAGVRSSRAGRCRTAARGPRLVADAASPAGAGKHGRQRAPHGAGDVTLSAEARDGSWSCTCATRGRASHPTFIDDAFDRFSGDSGRARGGTRLGLAIVAVIAEVAWGTRSRGQRGGRRRRCLARAAARPLKRRRPPGRRGPSLASRVGRITWRPDPGGPRSGCRARRHARRDRRCSARSRRPTRWPDSLVEPVSPPEPGASGVVVS